MTKTARTWAKELLSEFDAAGSAAVEPCIARIVAATRLDEALACFDLVFPEGNPAGARDRIAERIKLHRRDARRK